jgi:hypothetical protein
MKMPTSIDAMRERFLQSGDNADLLIVDAHHHFNAVALYRLCTVLRPLPILRDKRVP